MTAAILIATRNQGKIREFADMMGDLDIEWLSLDQLGIDMEVEETGATFTANACLKAAAYGRKSGLLTLADDSGLEVDALDGAPGVYTARYGGEDLSQEARYRFLLSNLEGVEAGRRAARFRAVIALADSQGEILTTVEGVCHGRIALAPRGNFGFGYDPVFEPEGQGGRTMAELPAAIKHQISHRGQAIAALTPWLKRWFREN